jgi:predicted nucleotide-binding protein
MALSRIYPEDSLDEYNARAYSTGLECARGLLQADLDFVQRYGVPIELESSTVTDAESSGNAVFIVHGRNEGHKQSVARVLEQLGMEALILHERPDGGRTIIEKLEEYGNAKFAIVVLSADDVGGLSGDTPALCPRARQNVILELGYFLGRLGRGRVCALYEEGVELPSDYAGVLYKLLDSAGHWKYAMADELRNAGFDVDKNSVK